jgi:hypothetical protein
MEILSFLAKEKGRRPYSLAHAAEQLSVHLSDARAGRTPNRNRENVPWPSRNIDP